MTTDDIRIGDYFLEPDPPPDVAVTDWSVEAIRDDGTVLLRHELNWELTMERLVEKLRLGELKPYGRAPR